MAIFSAIAAGTSAVTSGTKILEPVTNLFKTKEEGTGTTQRGTLAHAIDKLEKANDYEAIKAADVAKDVYRRTGSEQQAATAIARVLGYSSGSVLLSSSKWGYIRETLIAETRQTTQSREADASFSRQTAQPVPNMSSGSNPSFPSMSAVQSAGVMQGVANPVKNVPVVIIALLVGIFAWFNFSMSR